MRAKLILAFVFCFCLASAAVHAGLLEEVTTFEIKPEKNFTVGDTAYLSLHVVSGPSPINFSVNITGIEGSTTLADFDIVNITGGPGPFSYVYTNSWSFIINSLPVTFQAVITDLDNGGSITKNATTKIDADGDGYYSTASGGNDCDDTRASVHPGATEVCENGRDDDCSGGDASCGGSSGGNGGGGSGGGSGSLTSETFNCLEGKVTVAPNDKVLVKYKGTNYTFFVKDIMSNSVMFKLYPIPSRDIQLKEGTSKNIDLDWNNKNDLRIKVTDTRANVDAKVSCDFVTESANEQEREEKKEPILSNIKQGILNIASEVVPKDRASPIVGSIIALVIIVIGLLGYSLYKRRKQDEDEFGF